MLRASSVHDIVVNCSVLPFVWTHTFAHHARALVGGTTTGVARNRLVKKRREEDKEVRKKRKKGRKEKRKGREEEMKNTRKEERNKKEYARSDEHGATEVRNKKDRKKER